MFVESTLSRKILSAAREQQKELDIDVLPSIRNGIKTTTLENDESESETEEVDTLDADTYYENIVINEEDEQSIEMFMSNKSQPQRTLADIIMEKITERQTELQTQFSDAGSMQLQDIDPRVKQMYEGVRDVLKNYRSGKLPKAFKIVPNLRNWEQILYITGEFITNAFSVF
ncbi:hypothetical protein NQ317_007605 [Molorchus minor]|uniref:Bystin n=1 Tax=Molorchus minor TaxID=1323400 RepID=A0ABQ9JNM8_9CUCU|nr:hypothetical protein NQ317_007605 [Molorchus minor]